MEVADEKKQELLYKLSMFEQQMRHLQEQVDAVSQGVNELGFLSSGLDEFKDGKGKEILAPLGRGIFVPSKVSSDDLLVDIGKKTLVKKSIPETKEIIKEQTKKLIEIKEELNKNLEQVSKDAEAALKEFQD